MIELTLNIPGTRVCTVIIANPELARDLVSSGNPGQRLLELANKGKSLEMLPAITGLSTPGMIVKDNEIHGI